MDKLFLKRITELTEANNHTEARLEIAHNFDYLARFAQVFQAIKEIQEFEGQLPVGIHEYRYRITNQMLNQIEKTEGEKIMNEINSVL